MPPVLAYVSTYDKHHELTVVLINVTFSFFWVHWPTESFHRALGERVSVSEVEGHSEGKDGGGCAWVHGAVTGTRVCCTAPRRRLMKGGSRWCAPSGPPPLCRLQCYFAPPGYQMSHQIKGLQVSISSDTKDLSEHAQWRIKESLPVRCCLWSTWPITIRIMTQT